MKLIRSLICFLPLFLLSTAFGSDLLEISFVLEPSTPHPIIQIEQVRRIKGQTPEISKNASGYKFELLDKKGTLLVTQFVESFNAPSCSLHRPDDLDFIHYEIASPLNEHFALNFPHYPNARYLRVRNPKGIEMTKIEIPFLPEVSKEFYGLQGREEEDQTLDIAFIGHNFLTELDQQKFKENIEAFSLELLKYEPFKSSGKYILFHPIAYNGSLDCKYEGRLIACNFAKTKQIVNDAKVRYDKISIIVNSDTYGGSGGDISVSYNGIHGPKVFIHEFGHSFGGLIDEYNYTDSPGKLTQKIHANCFAGTPPAIAWDGKVNVNDYTLGCWYPNWYRSSPDSVMYSLGGSDFNMISRLLIEKKLIKIKRDRRLR